MRRKKIIVVALTLLMVIGVAFSFCGCVLNAIKKSKKENFLTTDYYYLCYEKK